MLRAGDDWWMALHKSNRALKGRKGAWWWFSVCLIRKRVKFIVSCYCGHRFAPRLLTVFRYVHSSDYLGLRLNSHLGTGSSSFHVWPLRTKPPNTNSRQSLHCGCVTDVTYNSNTMQDRHKCEVLRQQQ